MNMQINLSSLPEAWLSGDDKIIVEAKRRFKACEEWEARARINFDYDYKFANGDSTNMYQWDDWVVGDRITEQRPCLTINKTQQHNLQIINDGKQNKPGVNIRPVGETASYEAAQIFMEVIRHIEYISNAENAYDHASMFQVEAGWGCWRVVTEYPTDRAREQEIFIKRIKDPRSVYVDPDCVEVDNSDARFGFVFTDIARDLYEASYPDFIDVGGSSVFNNSSDSWSTGHSVRVCEYFRKSNKKDRLVAFILPNTGEEIEEFWSELDEDAKSIFDEIKAFEKANKVPKSESQLYERDVVRSDIEWFKIAGNVIIDRKPWAGKYIPLVKIIGKETVIDGVMDIRGHTRALLDPQRIYNINSSANVEFGALQTKSPLTAPAEAIEGLEEYYRDYNIKSTSVLPYNQYNEEGKKLDAPQRIAAPQSSPAYVQQMQIAQNEMMMVSGQYQSQMGENENAKSGIAINQRQKQGDRATYHFQDNQAIGIRYTGKILIDLVPKIYDTKRVFRIEAKDGSILNITVDPNSKDAYQKLPNNNPNPDVAGQQTVDIIFNPNVGNYAVQSDIGPNFATRRQEAFNALTQIAAQNKEFMNIAGDILWKVADFPEAQVLAQRWRRIIPPNVLGDEPNPQHEEMMKAAAAQIEAQLAQIAQLTKDVEDRTRELDIKQQEVDNKKSATVISATDTMLDNLRQDFKALSERITALGNSGPAFTLEQIQPLIKQAIAEALRTGGPAADEEESAALPGPDEGGTPIREFTDMNLDGLDDEEQANAVPAG